MVNIVAQYRFREMYVNEYSNICLRIVMCIKLTYLDGKYKYTYKFREKLRHSYYLNRHCGASYS